MATAIPTQPFTAAVRYFHRNADERLAAGDGPQQLDGVGHRRGHHRHRHPGWERRSRPSIPPFTGTLTTGSSLVTGITSTTGLFAGENITGTGIPAGATIAIDHQLDRHHVIGERDGDRLPEPDCDRHHAVGKRDGRAVSRASRPTRGSGLLKVHRSARRTPLLSGSPAARPSARPTSPRSRATSTATAYTDLAYYQSSTATWYMDDSKNNTITSFTLGTPNSSVPVVGYFDANGPEEPAVFTRQWQCLDHRQRSHRDIRSGGRHSGSG